MDKDKIIQARLASNKAIAIKDVDGVARFWMDDIVVISGEGGKHSGKKNLVKVWKQLFAAGVPLFERLTAEVIVAESGQLAWESGSWNYLDGASGGSYAAMWRKVNGLWLTRSELFVSLD